MGAAARVTFGTTGTAGMCNALRSGHTTLAAGNHSGRQFIIRHADYAGCVACESDEEDVMSDIKLIVIEIDGYMYKYWLNHEIAQSLIAVLEEDGIPYIVINPCHLP